METMKAFWRYDWALNRGRLLTIVVVAVLWPWAMRLSQIGARDGAMWGHVCLICSSVGIILIPALLLEYVGDLGRCGAPADFRYIGWSWPLDSGRWALAKLASGLGWGVVVPTFLILTMTWAAIHVSDVSVYEGPPRWMNGFAVLSVVASCVLWVMVVSALFVGCSRRIAALLGVAVFVAGEMAVHAVTGIRALDRALQLQRPSSECAAEAGLCLAFVIVAAAVFVRFHRNRRPWQAAVLGLLALAACDGGRALLWW